MEHILRMSFPRSTQGRVIALETWTGYTHCNAFRIPGWSVVSFTCWAFQTQVHFDSSDCKTRTSNLRTLENLPRCTCLGNELRTCCCCFFRHQYLLLGSVRTLEPFTGDAFYSYLAWNRRRRGRGSRNHRARSCLLGLAAWCRGSQTLLEEH